MDPQVTLAQALICMQEDNRDEAIEALEELAQWLRKGGLMPQVDDAAEEDALLVRRERR